MIIVTFNKPDFEYDVHSLLKEFFPKEDIQMYYREPANFEGNKNLACTSHLITDETQIDFDGASHSFEIRFMDGCSQNRAEEISGTQNEIEKKERIEIFWSRGDEPTVSFRTFETTGLERKDRKNLLKQELYRMVEEGLGRGLPWGTLSGIRPTKIAMKMLDEGADVAEVFR